MISYQVRRFPENPIIRPEMDASIGTNINGPSLIRVPDWLPYPRGRYYLYFAHHSGKFIRLAYADALAGPWQIHVPGTLHLEQTACRGHIASPDLHLDHERRQLRMYFHGPTAESQRTFLATSADGLTFSAGREILGPFYFRVFTHNGAWYAIGKTIRGDAGGLLLRSSDGVTPFTAGPMILPAMRHAALRKIGDRLEIFSSRIGDSPERIVKTELSLAGDWRQWRPEPEVTVLQSEHDYEGADLPVEPSRSGAIHERVHQLRDPGLFEEDGRLYLQYSVAGEHGLAMAELIAD